MQPPTGGTILTAPSTGTSLKPEGRPPNITAELQDQQLYLHSKLDKLVASRPSSYQVRSVWPVRAATLHQSRPTNRTQDTVVTPWPGSDRPGAAPSQVFTDICLSFMCHLLAQPFRQINIRRWQWQSTGDHEGVRDPNEIASTQLAAVFAEHVG